HAELAARQRAPGIVGEPGREAVAVLPATARRIARRIVHLQHALYPCAAPRLGGQWAAAPRIRAVVDEQRLGLVAPFLPPLPHDEGRVDLAVLGHYAHHQDVL